MSHRAQEWLEAGAALVVLLALVLVVRFLRSPLGHLSRTARRLELALRKEREGSWVTMQRIVTTLEGELDGVRVTVRHVREHMGWRAGYRFEAVATATRPFGEKAVERRGEWVRVCEGLEARVSGPAVWSEDEVERLLRWAVSAVERAPAVDGIARAPAPRAEPPGEVMRLIQVFPFSLEELAANREGRIHPDQIARARSRHRRSLKPYAIVASLFVLLSGALAGAFYLQLEPPVSAVDAKAAVTTLLAGLVYAGVTLGFGSFLRGRSRRRLAQFEAGRAEVVEGPAELIALRGRSGVGDVHLLRVDGRSFYVPKVALAALTAGARYRVYTVNQDILSIEPANPERAAPSEDDPVEKAEYERELAHAERVKAVRPSKLVR